MIPVRQSPPVVAFLARHRVTVVIALMAVLASSGTAAAVSYLVLGKVNSTGATTTVKSSVNGTVLQITNTNTTGGTSARGLGITVPAGRAPLTVNSSAGKATNLNGDKLDGIDSTGFARGTNVTVLANRFVLDNGENGVNLLTLPGLGVLEGNCFLDSSSTNIVWRNTSSAVIDMWSNPFSDGHMRAGLVPANANISYNVAYWNTASPGMTPFQTGDTLVLG